MRVCPFCGSDNCVVKDKSVDYRDGTRYDLYVRCNDCHTRGPRYTIDVFHGEDVGIDYLRKRAIMSWNSRIEDMSENKLEDTIEDVRESVEEIASVVKDVIDDVADSFKESFECFMKRHKF